MQNLNPITIINDHFDKINDQIEISIESLMKNVSLEEANSLKQLREMQIAKTNEIKETNLAFISINNEKLKQKSKYLLDDNSLDFSLKVENLKEDLVLNDCILVDDEADLVSVKSLWVMPCFYDSKSLDFLKIYNKYFDSSEVKNEAFTFKQDILDKTVVKSICLVKEKASRLATYITDLRDINLNNVIEFSIKKTLEEEESDIVEQNFEFEAIETNAFSDLPNLDELNLSGCALSKLNIGALNHIHNLKVLNLSSNKLKELNKNIFDGLNVLEILDLYSNQITEIENGQFGHLKNLKYLNLSLNKISSIDENGFQELKKLELLDLSQNKIKSIKVGTFRDLSNLKNLVISNNELSDIKKGSFDGLNNLSEVNLNKNDLTKLDSGLFDHLSNLIVFYIKHNKIDSVNADVFRLNKLEILDLSSNEIGSLDANAFFHLKKLKYLNLSRNKLNSLDKNVFHYLKTLDVLLMNNNEISKLEMGTFESFIQLKVMYLNENKISQLDQSLFQNLKELKQLNIKKNPIANKCSEKEKPEFYDWLIKNNPSCVVEINVSK